jgi:MYXO-CTERM domain-containing protein
MPSFVPSRSSSLVFAALTLLPAAAAHANFVPNPSFETITACPTAISQIDLATPWDTAVDTSSPDLYNSCAPTGSPGFVGIMSNSFGSQTPRTGAGYAGIISRPINDYREYLEVELTAPMMAGYTYEVSFYVSLADNSQQAIDRLGAYIGTGARLTPGVTAPLYDLTPQIESPEGAPISDKTGWTIVRGLYVATGGEDHIVVGNFRDNETTNITTGLGGPYQGSYYYVDDVSVELTDAPPVDAGVRPDASVSIDASIIADAGAILDASVPRDAATTFDGETLADADVLEDAGTFVDAATRDAATVDTDASTEDDAGANADAGASDDAGGALDASNPPVDSFRIGGGTLDGCACGVGGTQSDTAPWSFGVLAGLLMLRIRRSRKLPTP